VLVGVSALHVGDIGGRIGLVLSAVALVAVLRACGSTIRIDRAHLTLGFSPFWRSRLPRSRIIDITTVTVRPWEDFGGWGIKGSPRRKGLLYSAGGSEAIRVHLCDGRVYLASVRPGTSAEVLGQLQRWLESGGLAPATVTSWWRIGKISGRELVFSRIVPRKKRLGSGRAVLGRGTDPALEFEA